MARQFELPREAAELVAQVQALEEQAQVVATQLTADLAGIRDAATRERAQVDRASAALAKDREALEALLQSRVRGFEFIADAWADYERAQAERLATALYYKKHPAREAAREVRAKGKQLAELRRELKRTQWVLALYEFHFPWLPELRDIETELSYVRAGDSSTGASGRSDPVQRWLSEAEFAALSVAERNQRALDRYISSVKTPWQVGRDFERYIGYLRESAGAHVTYQGIFAGFDDLGRDLICTTDQGIEVVQCKRWSRKKTIHEKHVFQLFGTVVAMRIEHPETAVRGTFTTTTTLSERARQFAEQLDIRVEESVAVEDYPRIKCNVGRGDERIYHLPFDQQYDRTVIEPSKGERWVATVVDAEALGFRRAWRWTPSRS
ncbi:MAG: restriction endonuclease [Tepidisphaeraceae bacterium]